MDERGFLDWCFWGVCASWDLEPWIMDEGHVRGFAMHGMAFGIETSGSGLGGAVTCHLAR